MSAEIMVASPLMPPVFLLRKLYPILLPNLAHALWPFFEHGILDGIKPWSEIRLSLVAIPDKQSENFLLCAPNL